jgi:M6 family metalloprotease-like protein
VPAEGTVRNIVILACFSDHWNAGASTVNATYGRPPGDYTNLFNTVGYSTDGAAGSVRDYFSEVSYSKLTISSVVTNWVLLPNNEAYYGANDAWGNDLRPDVMVADAISAADTAGFDFSQGDGDGDGWVDIFTVIHSGLDEAYGGNPANCIWSHQGAMSSVVTVDGVNYFRYNTNPAHRGNSTTGITRIGVVCHEMTHFLGLPDLYDYSNTTYGTGTWCLMGSGSWGAGWTLSTAHRPVHMSAWCKYALGFLRPTDIHSQTSLSLPRVETNASAP